jgi:hypothetical protein
MVILFFATAKQSKNLLTNKEYSDNLKKGVLKEDANKCIGIDLSVMKDLQLNSLDNLLRTSDDIIKVQNDYEAFLKILEKRLHELQPDFKLQVHLKNKPHKLKEGILAFSWDEQKYPKSHKAIPDILEGITNKLTTTKNNLKTKSDDYSAEVEKLKQKQRGDNDARAYMKTDYRQIISTKTDHMVKSAFLTTFLIFVPVSNVDIFKTRYESLVKDCVVPCSGMQLCNNGDEKIRLFRVVLMDHLKEEFALEMRKVVKANCKEYDPEEIKQLPNLIIEQKVLEGNIEEKKVLF